MEPYYSGFNEVIDTVASAVSQKHAAFMEPVE
jgi:hypothetical protein